jgi:hypothetical protein
MPLGVTMVHPDPTVPLSVKAELVASRVPDDVEGTVDANVTVSLDAEAEMGWGPTEPPFTVSPPQGMVKVPVSRTVPLLSLTKSVPDVQPECDSCSVAPVATVTVPLLSSVPGADVLS